MTTLLPRLARHHSGASGGQSAAGSFTPGPERTGAVAALGPSANGDVIKAVSVP